MSVSRGDKLAVRAEGNLASVTSGVVAGKALFAVLLQLRRAVDQDLVVHALHSKPLL